MNGAVFQFDTLHAWANGRASWLSGIAGSCVDKQNGFAVGLETVIRAGQIIDEVAGDQPGAVAVGQRTVEKDKLLTYATAMD